MKQLGSETSTEYSFTGQVTGSTRNHYVTGTTGTAVKINTAYTYDHRNRLADTKKSINNAATPTVISRQEYNEVGQLRVKRLHSTNSGSSFADSVKYAYNPRGWLRESISPKFKQFLKYDTLANAQYNGNPESSPPEAMLGTGTPPAVAARRCSAADLYLHV